jgi:mannose/cellobiose epimerase-like protein (N-acyl-D-glucosamine 2-epimerase family)
VNSALRRGLFLLAFSAAVTAQQQVPRAEWWISHVIGELMPFWHQPAAWGEPWGNFPTIRCDNGSLYDPANPCPEINGYSWLRNAWNTQSLVALSRQTYAYGVLFHLTGDPTFMDLMRAGVAYIQSNMVDREHGGMHITRGAQGQPDANYRLRDPQQLAYGLLGMSFYYYLTRDAAILPEIVSIKNFIWANYYNESLDALQWTLDPASSVQPAESRRLTAQLDQMNAYMVMLAPLLPEAERERWLDDLRRLTEIMVKHFYVEKDNLYFLRADTAADTDIARTGTDFGHSIKALWMTRMTGLLRGDEAMVRWAEEKGLAQLERAWQPACGCWAGGVKAGGALELDKQWWVFAELDQFAASVAMTRPEYARFLPQTYDYWFTRFVDKPNGEVWAVIDGTTHQPKPGTPKQYTWKNGYHSLEHALVGYITSRQLHGEPATLYYNLSFDPEPGTLRPYFFEGRIESVERSGDWRGGEIQKVAFRDVR